MHSDGGCLSVLSHWREGGIGYPMITTEMLDMRHYSPPPFFFPKKGVQFSYNHINTTP